MTAIIGAVAGYGTTPSGGGGGGSSPAVAISDQFVFDYAVGTAQALYQISSDGSVRDHDNSLLENWLTGGGSVSDYEAMATMVSGTLTSGTAASWISCSLSPSWAVENTRMNNSTKTAVITVSIRLASSGAVQDTASITLSAESDNSL